ncbi:warA [Symbiodinium pilosum]|uniref:WarA protein n=1 Tax=Symbiodinium pilosum TaxID=2952 RepID=A0A812QCG2_SYMPI|nr:warA [Symbiodinium pilosum]
MWCKILSSRSDVPLVGVSSADKVDFFLALRWVDSPVPEGNFSVEADREVCCRITKAALEAKLGQLAGKRKHLNVFRYLAGRYEDFIGTPPRTRTPESFASNFHITSLEKSAKQRKGVTAVACAVLSGDVGMLRHLVKCRAQLDIQMPELWEVGLPPGCTALNLACTRGSRGLDILEELLKLRCDANACDQVGGPALCSCDDDRAVELLVRYNADINFAKPPTKTPALCGVCARGAEHRLLCDGAEMVLVCQAFSRASLTNVYRRFDHVVASIQLPFCRE